MRKLFMQSRLVMFGQLVLGIDERRPYLAPGQVSLQFLTASHKRKIDFALDEIRLGKHDALLNYACIDSFSVLHDRDLVGQLYGYDPDGDAITAQLVSGPSNGTLTFHPDGTFTYTPNTHYVGPDGFTYTWSDGLTASEPAMVRIDVYNHAPDAQDDSYRVLHDRTLQGNVKSNDSDEDVEDREHLTVRLISGPQHAKTNPDGSMAFQLREDGSFTYTPAAGYVGSDAFVYALSDGVEESLAEVSIYIYNEPPVVHATQTYLVALTGNTNLWI
jgi:hypothetical protein